MTLTLPINIIDLEATCWDGPPPDGAVSEIIEIGLCVQNAAGPPNAGRHQIVVRPQESGVSDFCTHLTGWTTEALTAGVTFRQATERLVSEFDSRRRLMVSWGGYDDRQIRRQCTRLGLQVPLGPADTHHLDLKAAHQAFYGLQKRLGLGRALTRAGLGFEGRAHVGADDAWNVGRLLTRIQQDGFHLPLP